MTKLLEVVEQIEKRANKATKGRWRCKRTADGHTIDMRKPGSFRSEEQLEYNHGVASPRVLDRGTAAWSQANRAIANAKFLAHARTDVPALCAALRVTIEATKSAIALLNRIPAPDQRLMGWADSSEGLAAQAQDDLEQALLDAEGALKNERTGT